MNFSLPTENFPVSLFWEKKGMWQKSCHIPFFRINGVQSAVLRYSLNKWQNMKNYFSVASLILRSKRWFHNLFLKQCSKACICGNKSNQTKNRRSYFCLAVLITWCRTAFSQPLSLNGVLLPTPRSQVTIFIKHEKLFFEIAPCDSELNDRLTTSFLKRCSRSSFFEK